MVFTEFLLGKKERLSWVAETSYADGGTMSSGEIIGLNARIEPAFNKNWQEILSAGASNRSIQGRVLGPLDLPFTLVFTPVDWKFLKYCGYSVADAGGPTYTHTFTLADAVASFKLEWALRATTSVVITLTGCVVLGGTISFAKATGSGGEGFIQVSLRCIGKAYSIGSSVTSLSAITRTPFQWRHVRLTLNNSEVVEVNNGELLIDNGIDVNDSRYCNVDASVYISEPIPKIHRITGRVNVNVKDNTYVNLWDSDDEISNCSLDFEQNATNNKLEADFSGFRIDTALSATNLENPTSADIPFSAESFSSLVASDTISTY